MDAKTYSEHHSKLRLVQRYGLRLSVEQLRKAVATIQMGRAVVLKKQSHSRTLFAVQLGRDDTWVPVVYSRSRKAIVTVLPENVLRRHRTLIQPKVARSATTQPVKPPADEPAQQPAVLKLETGTPATVDLASAQPAVVQPAAPLFRLQQDKHIDRFNMFSPDPKCKPRTELYFREVLGRKCMTYARSKKLCAAGKEKILEMFEQQLGGWFPGACEYLASELHRVGLEW